MTSSPPDPQRAKILVVDDRPENIFALGESLRRPDYEIFSANSGEEALKLILKHEFAVILLDVLMPGMDGFETASLIHRRQASRHVPIIFLTATSFESHLVYKGYSVGAVDYLVKPVDPDVVKAKVSVFVELYRKDLRIREQQQEILEVERLRSQEALREGDALYQATLDQAPVGILHVAPSGRCLRVNHSFCQLVGISDGEVLTSRIQDFVYLEDRRSFMEGLTQLGTSPSRAWTWEGRLSVGEWVAAWASMSLSVVRSSTGEVRHFIVVVEDATERRLAHERQRFLAAASESLLGSLEARKTLHRVVEVAVEGVADWCLVSLDPEAEGHPRDLIAAAWDPQAAEVIAQLRRWLVPSDPAAGAGALAPREGRCIPDLDHSPNPALGELIPVGRVRSAMWVPLWVREENLGVLIFATEGIRRGAYRSTDLAMAEDLAHRISLAVDNSRLYRDSQESVRLRDEFLSIASHELRTPLTPLQILFQRFLGQRAKEPLEKIPPQQLKAMLLRSERQLQRLVALVDNLLDVSRISAGLLDLNPEPFDLAELTRDVVARFTEELARAGCELHLELDARVEGRWDRLRVEQVLTNLLSNALKYGPGKPIEVRLVTGGGAARLDVRDHGIGIKTEELDRIFGRFERAVSARAYGGLGLGLYIARQIADAHGGTIHVQSAPGAGSVFTLELPLDAEGPSELQLHPKTGDHHGISIRS